MSQICHAHHVLIHNEKKLIHTGEFFCLFIPISQGCAEGQICQFFYDGINLALREGWSLHTGFAGGAKCSDVRHEICKGRRLFAEGEPKLCRNEDSSDPINVYFTLKEIENDLSSFCPC